MTSEDFARRWWATFFQVLEASAESTSALRQAALDASLTAWTTHLTHTVVLSCEDLELLCAAKGHRGTAVPVKRSEYLGLDVMAFPPGQLGWRLPIVACELENSRHAERIAYSLWKVLCVRARLRLVFCYRPDLTSSADLVVELARAVIEPLSIPERLSFQGETLVVVGSRGAAETFPYGFFRAWKLEKNTGLFQQFPRE